MMRSGFFSLSGRTRPKSEKTFSCAFSRTEQVLNKMMSASSGWVTCSIPPCSSARTDSIFSLSYSFIWHPKVRINTFFMVCLIDWLVVKGFRRPVKYSGRLKNYSSAFFCFLACSMNLSASASVKIQISRTRRLSSLYLNATALPV